jgi:hypothetical protein
MLAVCPAGSPARRACIDACGLGPGVAQDRARGLEIFRMVLEIRCRPEMPELMRRHVNPDMPLNGSDDLYRNGGLALPAPPCCHEEMAIHVGTQARQYVTAIPSKSAGNFVRDLTDKVFSFGLCLPGGNVKEQLTPRTIWFGEVVLPAQGAQVLRPEWRGERDINRDRNLGFDKANAAPVEILCNFPHQLLGEKIELGAKAIGL